MSTSRRLDNLRAAMAAARIDLLALIPGGSLRYMTGLSFHAGKRLSLTLIPAADRPPVLVLPAALVRSILTPLVDREPLRVDPTAVDAVTLERGGKTRAIDPAKGDLGPDEQAALGALAALGAAAAPTSFTRPAALDAHPSRVTIRVRTRGDAAPTSVTLVACPRTDDATWDLFVPGAPAVFRIERARLAPILAVAP